MEKLIFMDGTELSYDAISQAGNVLTISFNNGDLLALEETFSHKGNLEKMIQADEQGNRQAMYKNYTILRQLTKRKNIVVDEIEETTADIVDVVLEQESEIAIALRKLQEGQAVQDGAIEDLGAVTSELAERGGLA